MNNTETLRYDGVIEDYWSRWFDPESGLYRISDRMLTHNDRCMQYVTHEYTGSAQKPGVDTELGV